MRSSERCGLCAQTYEGADSVLQEAIEIEKQLHARDLALTALADELGARLQLAESDA